MSRAGQRGDESTNQRGHQSTGITVRTLTESQDALWERGLARSDEGTWLQWLPWLRCVGRHLGGVTVLGLERAGQLIGGVAGLVEQSPEGRRLRTIYLTAYHGLWVADSGLRLHARESLVREVAEALVPHLNAHWDRWAFSSAPELTDGRPFLDLGCHVAVQYTYRLDLLDDEAMLARMENNVRRHIRRAEEAGVIVEVCAPTAENFQIFEQLQRLVGERQGWDGERFPTGLFAELAAEIQAAGCGQLFLARTRDGRPAAALLCTWDRHRAYALFGSSDPEVAKGGCERYLSWRAYQWLRERGHREVDQLGANYQNLRAHKRDWNGRLVSYLTVSGGAGVARRTDHLRAAAKHLWRALRPWPA